MLLIYSENTSTRLQYICKFIFEELLNTTFSLTLHELSFAEHTGAKINYSNKQIQGVYHIKPHGLLFETGIKSQEIICTGAGETLSFFNTEEADHSFDIFAAAFFLISRYEEYLPHKEDEYGRYAHQNSAAFKNKILRIPLVNIWVKNLRDQLNELFPSFIPQPASGFVIADGVPQTNFQPTYDIDMAWSYKEKGLLRNAVGFLRKPSFDRISTLFRVKPDPFDSYDFLDKLHQSSGLKPIYFFPVAKQNGAYDKNILPSNEAMQQLIKRHADKYTIGLHPSWKSNQQKELLSEEKNTLEKIAGKKIATSRQHYIKLSLPQTYQNLLSAGITAELSMGYGSINGFRASVASSFFWYDISTEQITPLRIHPFCFMDANCFYEQKLSVAAAYEEMLWYYNACKNVNGTMISIFHNNFLGTDKTFAGWREMYEKFIAQLH